MSTEPCGSLPVTTWSAMASYCHHHMAWHASVATCHQTAEDKIHVIHRREATFGPFDAWEDVAAWLEAQTHDPSVVPPG